MMKTQYATEKITLLVKKPIPGNPNLMSTCEGLGIILKFWEKKNYWATELKGLNHISWDCHQKSKDVHTRVLFTPVLLFYPLSRWQGDLSPIS